MNAVGEKTLAYMRGERDLFEERKRIEELKKLEEPRLPYWVTGRSKRRMERFWQMVACLQENSRMSLVEMSKRLKVPVSTLFETLKEIEKVFCFTIVLKEDGKNVALGETISAESSNQATPGEENTSPLKLPMM